MPKGRQMVGREKERCEGCIGEVTSEDQTWRLGNEFRLLLVTQERNDCG